MEQSTRESAQKSVSHEQHRGRLAF